MQLIYLLFGLIQNIWIHIWCLTSCGVRSASARAFNTCAREVREQQQARARDARANRGARARCARARPRCARVFARAPVRHARAQISSPKVDLVSLFAIWRACARRAYLRARVSDGCARERARASWPCSRTSRARAPLFARASRARACRCSRTSRAHVLNARAPACARFQQEMFHMF